MTKKNKAFSKLYTAAAVIVLILGLAGCRSAGVSGASEDTEKESTVPPERKETPEAAATEGGMSEEPTGAAEGFKLPETGTKLHGFMTEEICDVPEKEGKAVSFLHEGTGARVVAVLCDEPKATVTVAFATRAENDGGLPHIFEHAVQGGSEKYPSPSWFSDMPSQTFICSAEGSSGQYMTELSCSSYSQEQLLSALDVCLQGFLHPLILQDERILLREGARSVLGSINGSLRVTGTVYNEMNARAGDVLKAAINLTMKTLYPDSFASFSAGGEPEALRSVTWQEVKDYHERYFHPSNCLVVLYGKQDYEPFLKYLDEEGFAGYEKRSYDFTADISGDGQSLTTAEAGTGATETGAGETTAAATTGAGPSGAGIAGAETAGAVAAETGAAETADTGRAGTAGAAITTVEFTLPDAASSGQRSPVIIYAKDTGKQGSYEAQMTDLLTGFLNDGSSPLRKRMEELFPEAEFTCGHMNDAYRNPVLFILAGADRKKSSLFQEAVDECLLEMVKGGVPEEAVPEYAKRMERLQVLSDETAEGTELTRKIAGDWSQTGNPFAWEERRAAEIGFQDKGNGKLLSEMIENLLYASGKGVLTVTAPEKKAASAEKNRTKALAKEKKSMSSEELEAVIAAGRDFDRWMNANQTTPSGASATAVAVTGDVAERAKRVPVREETINGVKMLFAETSNEAVVEETWLFDASMIPREELHVYAFYTYLLGKLGTKQHSPEEIRDLCGACTLDCDFDWSNETINGKGAGERFRASFRAMSAEAGDARRLMGEILTETEFSDHERLRMLAAEQCALLKRKLQECAKGQAAERAGLEANEEMLLNAYMGGPEYIAFLEEAAAMDASRLRNLEGGLKRTALRLIRRTDLTIAVCASAENAGLLQDAAEYAGTLRETVQTRGGREFEKSGGRECFVADKCSNALGASWQTLGTEPGGTMLVLEQLLNVKYLRPELRFRRGAESAGCEVSEKTGIVLYTSGDTETVETFRYFEALPELLERDEITEAELEMYKRLACNTLLEKMDERQTAEQQILEVLCGTGEENRCAGYLKEIAETKAEDVKALGKLLKKLADSGHRTTFAPAEVLAAYEAATATAEPVTEAITEAATDAATQAE